MRRLIVGLSSLTIAASVLAGCTAFQGVRLRAVSPPIDDPFRKLSLAVTVDSFQVTRADPFTHLLETGWRDLRTQEMSDEDRTVSTGEGRIECRISIRLEERGKMFDLFLTPWLRYGGEGKDAVVAGPKHPLREKWEAALRQLLVVEMKEED